MPSLRKFFLAALFCCLACSPAKISNPRSLAGPYPALFVPLTGPTLQFFTFGDWGSGDANQNAVAQAVKNFCLPKFCDFGLLLGDNFYENGVESIDDPLWQSRFEQVYRGVELPFYAVLGNHDHGGNIQAQIAYTDTPGQNRWKMPDRQFTVTFGETEKDPLIEIFAVDSTTFSAEDASKLGEALNHSNARWKILAMHHPIYSNGPHGDTPNLIDIMLPLICHKVDLVLVGHDHLFSHLIDPHDGCGNQHLVVGTGGKSVYQPRPDPDPRVLFTLSEFGFASLKVTPQQILIQFHETDGNIPYEFTLQK